MKIIQPKEAHIDQYAGEIADLMYATGPVTYDYQFHGRALFDLIIDASWRVPGTLFGHDGTTLAVNGNELLGIEVGFPGSEFKQRKKTLGPLWSPLIESGQVSGDQLAKMGRRTYFASYLNVSIPGSVYYVHALSVKEPHRGKGIGQALMRNAIEAAKQAGLRGLHLDVLSDNPAVKFYRALGMDCLTETTAPHPLSHGVPMEMRMAMDFAPSA